jgi:hypothetical protein
METGQDETRPRVQIRPLAGADFFKEVAGGIGRAAGLTLLWVLEIVRDAYFGILDRLNVRPRHKRASAFPPGQPRKRKPAP